jgi:hypothetical protein
VTKKFTGPEYDEIDPRIRAVLQDQTPSQPPATYSDSYGRSSVSGNISGGYPAADQYADEDEVETAQMPAAPNRDAPDEWAEQQQDWSEWSRPPLPRYGPQRDDDR